MLEHDAFHLEPLEAAEHIVEIFAGKLVDGDEGAIGETDDAVEDLVRSGIRARGPGR